MKKLLIALLFMSQSALADSGCYELMADLYEETRIQNNDKSERYRQKSTTGKIIKKVFTPRRLIQLAIGLPSLPLVAAEKGIKVIGSKDKKDTSLATLIVSHQIKNGDLRMDLPEDGQMITRFLEMKKSFEEIHNDSKPLSNESFAEFIVSLDKSLDKSENPFCDLDSKNKVVKVKKLKDKKFDTEEIMKKFAQYNDSQKLKDNLDKLTAINGRSELAPSHSEKCRNVLPSGDQDGKSIESLKAVSQKVTGTQVTIDN